MRGYRLGRSVFNIICYADDLTLVAENENDLWRLVYNFNNVCQKYNLKIAEEKTKSIKISHDPLRCKIVINDRIIEQVIQVDYLGTRLTSNNLSLIHI